MPAPSRITAEQVRAGRAMARIEQGALALRSGVSLETIKRIERLRGPVAVNPRTRAAILRALADLGVEFEFYGPAGEGVRLRSTSLDADGAADPAGRALSGVAAAPALAVPTLSPGMLAYWDRNLKCLYANEGYLEWFGRDRSDMLGLSIHTLMGDELFSTNEAFIRAALSGETQMFERSLKKPAGAVGHTRAHYFPDRDENGRVAGFRALVVDITPLKAAEQSLADARSALAKTRRDVETVIDAKVATVAALTAERLGRKADSRGGAA